MLHQHVDKLLGEVLQNLWIAVGNVGNEINQIAQRNDTRVRSRRGRRHENFSMRFILVVLGAKILNVRPEGGMSVNRVSSTDVFSLTIYSTDFGSRRILCCKLGLVKSVNGAGTVD